MASAAVVFVVGWMTLEAPTKASAPVLKDTDAGAAPAKPDETDTTSDAGGGASGALVEDLDAGLVLTAPLLTADGSILPTSGPRAVKIGVVLVTFAGAEGAPANARSKKDALAIAERLGQDAKNDFHHAVTTGDSGSSDDIGRIPRGVLDPRTEVSVFALAPGEISDVLETPKGYWIVKRID